VIIEAGGPLHATSADAFIGLGEPTEPFGKTLVCAGVEAYAREVFEFFRQCDRAGVKRIFCEAVPEVGIGAALMDRLRRAAEK
jgi:L-threonylcarbamoyladenylate synthase